MLVGDLPGRPPSPGPSSQDSPLSNTASSCHSTARATAFDAAAHEFSTASQAESVCSCRPRQAHPWHPFADDRSCFKAIVHVLRDSLR